MAPTTFYVRILSLRANPFCQCLGFHVNGDRDRSTSSDFKTTQVRQSVKTVDHLSHSSRCTPFDSSDHCYLYFFFSLLTRVTWCFTFNSARPSKLTAKIIIAGIWFLACSLATPMAIARRVTMVRENSISKLNDRSLDQTIRDLWIRDFSFFIDV